MNNLDDCNCGVCANIEILHKLDIDGNFIVYNHDGNITIQHKHDDFVKERLSKYKFKKLTKSQIRDQLYLLKHKYDVTVEGTCVNCGEHEDACFC